MIGKGGMGAVYEAIQEPIERRVAIKVLHGRYAQEPEIAQRFFNEARAVNIVDHPGIVQISDYGQLPTGVAYLVMEFLKGDTLGQRLKQSGGKLAVPEVVRISRQIAAALAAAHEKGVIHRDAYVISKVCFHVGHFGPQRRRNKPCPLTAPAAASSALTSH
jgi:serine/threonine protein kinase